MSQTQPQPIYLKDYSVPEYLIDHTELHIELSADNTCVRSRLTVRRNPDCKKHQPPLVLMGEELELISIKIDNNELSKNDFIVHHQTLTLTQPPQQFTLEINNRIHPANNTALSGLYLSKDMLCTQCEAEGFRRITWFLDRPDVMSTFDVTLLGDKTLYPILLSNGNRTGQGELSDNKHWASWHDPFPKPSYLFALVAGNLACLKDTFTTASGRSVDLEIYVEAHDINKCQHAMQSLINAMRWDEKAFGREYDLNLYMIVAVSHFNMGAMENKGLNVFNTKFVLASKQTATDTDFENIEAVIGHEYFHNWSGNRITCRDWFQLSLKEGFTVFRDQQFTADQTSPVVKRIKDVNMLRTYQFTEDAGPLAHPIRPDSYIEINNFYTLTVYEKGAEVVRMLHTLLGEQGFRKGSDLYFERHDGQAVTTEDFIKAMEDSNAVDLTQFKRWYDQAGTPVVEVTSTYDASHKEYRLTFKQSCPATPQQTEKKPFHIPISIGLIDSKGLPIQLADKKGDINNSSLLELTEAEQTFNFSQIDVEPTPSILRDFSAPVKLLQKQTLDTQLFLFQHDCDLFNRWEAGQNCLNSIIFKTVSNIQQEQQPDALPEHLIEAFRSILQQPLNDLAYQSLLLKLPEKAYLIEQMAQVDIDVLFDAYRFVKKALASSLKDLWLSNYRLNQRPDAGNNAQDIAQRSFKNLCLDYLSTLNESDTIAVCCQQFEQAKNMTDQIAALSQITHLGSTIATPYLDRFYKQWKHEDLVIDKWFSLQACTEQDGALTRVKKLLQHPDFDFKTPNRVRSVIGSFATANLLHFNAADGSGYAFIADNIIELDPINPQVAARLANSLSHWKKFDPQRQHLIKQQLMRIKAYKQLSKDVLEIISRSLDA